MEVKRNDATRNRPEGDRVIDGSYVFIDLPKFMDQLTHEKAWEKNDRNGITVFKSENITMVLSALQASATLNDISADKFITIQVLKGNVQIQSIDGEIDLGEQQAIVFHPKINHSITAVTDSYILITSSSNML